MCALVAVPLLPVSPAHDAQWPHTTIYLMYLLVLFLICFRHTRLSGSRFVLVAVYSGRQLAGFVFPVINSSLSLLFPSTGFFSRSSNSLSFLSTLPNASFQPFLFPFSDVVHGFHIESFSNIATRWLPLAEMRSAISVHGFESDSRDCAVGVYERRRSSGLFHRRRAAAAHLVESHPRHKTRAFRRCWRAPRVA